MKFGLIGPTKVIWDWKHILIPGKCYRQIQLWLWKVKQSQNDNTQKVVSLRLSITHYTWCSTPILCQGTHIGPIKHLSILSLFNVLKSIINQHWEHSYNLVVWSGEVLTLLPVRLSLALYTCPYVPSPMMSIMLNKSTHLSPHSPRDRSGFTLAWHSLETKDKSINGNPEIPQNQFLMF